MTDAAQRRDVVRASDLRIVEAMRRPAFGIGRARLEGLSQAVDLARGVARAAALPAEA